MCPSLGVASCGCIKHHVQRHSPALRPCHSLLALAVLQEQEMPRKLAEAAVRMRRASARLDVPPPSARRFSASNPLASLLPDVILGAPSFIRM